MGKVNIQEWHQKKKDCPKKQPLLGKQFKNLENTISPLKKSVMLALDNKICGNKLSPM